MDNLDIPDEQPTVVVLNPGDLTAEEAEKAQAQLEKGKFLNVFSFIDFSETFLKILIFV